MTQDQWSVYNAILVAELHLDELPEVMRQLATNFMETGHKQTAADWETAADEVQKVVEAE